MTCSRSISHRISLAFLFLLVSVSFLFTFSILLFPLISRAAARSASDELGQLNATSTIFTTNTANQWSGDTGLYAPEGVSVDTTNHRLFVGDRNNNRVLIFNLDSSNNLIDHRADYVLGQQNFLTTTSGHAADTMNGPNGLAYDGIHNRLFVADTFNHRVLVFDLSALSTGMSASHVLGATSLSVAGDGSITATSLSSPPTLVYDAVNDRLFVADTYRVMVFNVAPNTLSTGMSASYVLGQSNFTSSFTSTNATTTFVLSGLAYDATSSRLFAADQANSRVLVFGVAPGTLISGESASIVIGQSNFTNGNTSVVSATTTPTPYGLDYDGTTNRLFVIDGNAARVTVYNAASSTLANGTSAIYALGASDVNSAGSGAATQSTFSSNGQVAIDSTNNRLWVTDTNNNRILAFPIASGTIANGENANDLVGQLNGADTPVYTNSTRNNGGNGTPSNSSLNGVSYSTIDTTNHRLFVADSSNHRILVFSLDSSNNLADHMADYVLGQSNFTGSNSGTTSSTLNSPLGMTYDAANSRLFAADASNHRILIYNLSSGISNGMPASNVLGQTVFTTASSSVTSSTMTYPEGLSYDQLGNRLFVSDYNNRILIYNLSSGISNGMPASNVLGQSSFTTSASGVTSSTVDSPEDVFYDASSTLLFVADARNNRILVYNAASGTLATGAPAIGVIGQTDFTSNNSDTTQSNFNFPLGLSYNQGNHRLYIGDNSNNRMMIYNLVQLATSSLPLGTYNTPYSGTISTSFSEGTVSLALASGTLPTGMSFASGAFLGAPTVAGTFSFGIVATDTLGGVGSFFDQRDYVL